MGNENETLWFSPIILLSFGHKPFGSLWYKGLSVLALLRRCAIHLQIHFHLDKFSACMRAVLSYAYMYIYIYICMNYIDTYIHHITHNATIWWFPKIGVPGTPKSSILLGFSLINHLFWGAPISGNTWYSIEYMMVIAKASGRRWEQLAPGRWLFRGWCCPRGAQSLVRFEQFAWWLLWGFQ